METEGMANGKTTVTSDKWRVTSKARKNAKQEAWWTLLHSRGSDGSNHRSLPVAARMPITGRSRSRLGLAARLRSRLGWAGRIRARGRAA